MIFITRQAEFSAAHTLAKPEWSEEENRRVYGDCAHPSGHGHNYTLEVTVAGPVNPETGMLFDLKELKKIMQERVIDQVDHKNLNCDPAFLEGIVPTAENVAVGIYGQLHEALPPGILHRVRLYESPRNYVDYYGPNGGK